MLNSGRIVSEREALSIIAGGGVVAAPTETYYALATDPFNVRAVDRLLSLKERSLEAGVPVIVSSADVINPFIEDCSDSLCRVRQVLQNQFWPGPLTLVVRILEHSAKSFAPGVLAPDGTLAVRVSSCLSVCRLAESLSGVITATSANPKSQTPPKAKEAVWRFFPDLPVYTPETLAAATEMQLSAPMASTIISLKDPEIRLLREGAVPFEEIQRVLSY